MDISHDTIRAKEYSTTGTVLANGPVNSFRRKFRMVRVTANASDKTMIIIANSSATMIFIVDSSGQKYRKGPFQMY
jgi:hypothetical protein